MYLNQTIDDVDQTLVRRIVIGAQFEQLTELAGIANGFHDPAIRDPVDRVDLHVAAGERSIRQSHARTIREALEGAAWAPFTGRSYVR